MTDKFETSSGVHPTTEFERSIALNGASADDPSSSAGSKAPPLVDAYGSVLKSVRPEDAGDQIHSLKAEIEHLRQAVAAIAAAARGVATENVDLKINDMEEALKRNVFASVGIAAFIGYLWGRTR